MLYFLAGLLLVLLTPIGRVAAMQFAIFILESLATFGVFLIALYFVFKGK